MVLLVDPYIGRGTLVTLSARKASNVPDSAHNRLWAQTEHASHWRRVLDHVDHVDHVIRALSGMADMDARVSLERLDVDNYATWSVRMRFALISKGLWKHVIERERELLHNLV